MKKCNHCKTKFPTKTIFNSYWMGYKKFKCLHCQSEYEFTLKDRIIGGLVAGVSTFFTSMLVFTTELDIIWKFVIGVSSMVLLGIVFGFLSLSFLSFKRVKTEQQKIE